MVKVSLHFSVMTTELVLAELLCCDCECVFCNSLVFYVSAFYLILWAVVSAGYPALLSCSYFEQINDDDDDEFVEVHPHWPVYADIFEHPPPRLASRRPIWSDMTAVDTTRQITSYTVYAASENTFIYGLEIAAHCDFLLTKFEGGLNLLHEADDDADIWLESTATAALVK